jgi:S-formylglutathione hydrolase FrmB
VRFFVFSAALVIGLAATAAAAPSPLGSFAKVETGPAGGTVWKGVIPGSGAGATGRASYVYLPPGFSRRAGYPVVYLLHGLPGGPTSYVYSLRLADAADRLVSHGVIRPFIAVAPPAGPNGRRPGYYDGEWAGPWEDYLVRDVVPWVDTTLPTIASTAGRTIGGLSAGAFGAVSIGLRHPELFGTLESWSGYFRPLPDGPLAHASRPELAAHDPSLLVRRDAPLLRRLGVRFELSTGVGHGSITPALTMRFARELRSLGLAYSLWRVPEQVRGPDYRDQMIRGLRYALARGA